MDDHGISIKRHLLKCKRRLDWSEIVAIDLTRFETQLVLKDQVLLLTDMQYEQQLELRRQLRKIVTNKIIV